MNTSTINKSTFVKQNSAVAVFPCSTYNETVVCETLEKSLKSLGGLHHIIKNNSKVLIKPNMLSAKNPEKAVTTHPSVVKAVVLLVQNLGAKVFIGDSPAGISKPIKEYWEATKMEEVAQQTGAELLPFEKKGVVERFVNGKSYFISKSVAEMDVIINVCKMKTHGLTLMTGAIKNMFGCIPGVKKGEFHKVAPKTKDFSQILVDIFQIVNPQLTIMDAVFAMEGNGPSSGNPKKVGLMLSSFDAVAIDAIASYIMGFQEDEILTTNIASARGLGQKKLENIEFLGLAQSQLKQKEFQLPSNRYIQLIPEFLMKLVGKLIWIRPKAIPAKCKKCGLCIKNCPVNAMISEEGIPKINYNQCIQCFCCDEICPYNAIEQKMSWLAMKLR